MCTCDGGRLIDMHPSCPALYTEVPPVKCLGKNRRAIVNKFVIRKGGDVIGYCRGGSKARLFGHVHRDVGYGVSDRL